MPATSVPRESLESTREVYKKISPAPPRPARVRQRVQVATPRARASDGSSSPEGALYIILRLSR